ncbi:hypothetical protein Kpol_1033p8 [Vanderwaltozyma polyspora DSM 70294]|uniref:EXS domain-containing protein n=1 Tax=Vanderwaltozyma polyspora (strain ATCC 22028 / DSM 70294 / BCRC 21397 / CBS 2163 / NBRC 10782 / NRRL Y-8283 / UCD 57-17) TaxID=436907 RepID=A7TJ06_VANPO|nr:uncharacterized protein Kpol_1033p8 [Vanderwaltozyma polyspora DSM 70294]EDO17705.1 hypothetical protein Kpol_1033p8 [Vanderwaltozyma polyspora DSM 70294]
MRFGDFITESAIPEWKGKYIQYNTGKKRLKEFAELLSKEETLEDSQHLIEAFPTEFLGPSRPLATSDRGHSHPRFSRYSYLQNEFIREFIDHWLISQEISKCNDFFLWLLEQCQNRYEMLQKQVLLYKRHGDLSYSVHGSLLASQRSFVKKGTQSSYGSLTSLLKYADEQKASCSKQKPKSAVKMTSRVKEFLRHSNLLPSIPQSLKHYFRFTSTECSCASTQFSDITIIKARRMLDDALLELYLYIELVRTFRNVNATGVRKIVKKFDKICKTHELKYVIQDVPVKFMIFRQYIDISNQSRDNKPNQESGRNNVANFFIDNEDPLKVWEDQIKHWYTVDLSCNPQDRKKRNEQLKKLSLEDKVNERTIHRSNRSIVQMFIGGLGIGFSTAIVFYICYCLKTANSKSVLYMRSILLPYWGSWFLIYFGVLLFLLDSYIWHRTGINYRFIMFGEMSQRNGSHFFNHDFSTSLISLHFYFLAFFALICAVCAGLSFFKINLLLYASSFLIILFGLFFLPITFIPYWDKFKRSKRWIIVGLIRLVFSGAFPVEFGDFFWGVVFCSLTYSLAEIAVFNCLISNTDNDLCRPINQSSATILSCLPNFWRFLQCLRRYADSRDAFPHLPNAVKYAVGVAFSYTFCKFRLAKDHSTTKSIFIIVSLVNSCYTIFWDLLMDWSLFQKSSKNLFLRDDLYLAGTRNWKTGEYKFTRRLFYYICMIINVSIRLQWIVFIILPIDMRSNEITTYVLALTELFRRAIWIIFRVENEHVANVQLYKVTGETTLPYNIAEDISIDNYNYPQDYSPLFTPIDPDQSNISAWKSHREQERSLHNSIKHRRASLIENLSNNMYWAHTTDFQRPRAFSTILQGFNENENNS